MKNRTGFYLSLLLCFYSSHSFAKLYFLPANSFANDGGLSAFPSGDSSDQATDLQTVLNYQQSRTSEDCTRANTEVSISLATFFGGPYGSLTDQQVSSWSAFFKKVMDDTDYFTDEAKSYWARPRPYVVDGDVQPCVPKESADTSYPSGHATISRVWADVLSAMNPSQQQAFLARADQIALDRVIGGVHYPTDIAAGKTLGDAIYNKLAESSAYQSALSQLDTTN